MFGDFDIIYSAGAALGPLVCSYFAENVAMAEASLGNLEVDPEVGDYSAAATGGTPNYQVGNGDCMGGYATPSGEEVWTEGWTAFHWRLKLLPPGSGC